MKMCDIFMDRQFRDLSGGRILNVGTGCLNFFVRMGVFLLALYNIAQEPVPDPAAE